jgi:hypothetical protein
LERIRAPGNEKTIGHGTTSRAQFWKKELGALLESAPKMLP